ncbi:GntP family permease [Paenibacillus alkaliterrae]|uniref:GntP family permease n=1 Tax=Paenibacillus alkaliterrae TaxID=320909 RepID=UPI001F1C8B62|nr:GntP family permease [Paenibacillus alkaliterrae]MCF2940482.1 GntP family permease [Paenibacillus alkaliterrae]
MNQAGFGPEIVQLGPVILVLLLFSIVFIVYATAKWKLHPFLSIISSTYILALGTNLIGEINGVEAPIIKDIGATVSGGFGGIITSIGLVIIFGTIIGKILEKTGAAVKMAEVVLRLLGDRHPAIAMSIIGWIVSIPVFCDSGYVILSSLKKSLAKRSGVNVVTLSVALSTGLYATHTLVPPTPGPIAAATNVGIGPDGLFWVIVIGLIVSIPVAFAGYVWARKVADKLPSTLDETTETFEEYKKRFGKLPSAWAAFGPIVVPIILLALGSLANFPVGVDAAGNKILLMSGFSNTLFTFLGSPVNALFIGVLLAIFTLLPKRNEENLTKLMGEGLMDSAIIIMITGAGGALGAVIKATPIADYVKSLIDGNAAFVGVGALILAFIIAAVLKTAQGSSTASLVITSTIMMPLLPSLGLTEMMGTVPIGQMLTVMAIGCGAMVVSHVNDSYFWVVTQFSGMKLNTAYRAQTMATLVQGVVGIIVVAILGVIFL